MCTYEWKELVRMGMFRKKPVVIEARQITGYTDMLGLDGIAAWCGGWVTQVDPGPAFLMIPTLEGTMRGDVGDWIIKGVNGEFYPCKPDIFDKTYEPA
jgi:hypothetical protein